MTEPIVETIPDNAENTENADINVESTVVEEVKPVRKRGRPPGAKDTKPRQKRVVIVEEPLAPPEPEPATPATPAAPEPATPATPAAPEPPKPKQPRPARTTVQAEQREPDPASPRTVLREASRSILELKRLESGARKAHLLDMYSKGLHMM